MLGNNMFAYCLNNPVVLIDNSGTAAHIGFSHDGQIHDAPWRIGSPGGGGWPQDIHYSRQDYGSVMEKFYIGRAVLSVGRVYKFVFNTDEQVVLDAEHFAFYRGQLVIRQDWAIADGRSGSFGIMFLHVSETDPTTVKHEWGHYVQLRQMGLFRYLINVAIPSRLSDPYDPYYYSNPWERTADFWAGVDRGGEYRDGSLLWGFSQYVIGWPSVPLFYLFGK